MNALPFPYTPIASPSSVPYSVFKFVNCILALEGSLQDSVSNEVVSDGADIPFPRSNGPLFNCAFDPTLIGAGTLFAAEGGTGGSHCAAAAPAMRSASAMASTLAKVFKYV
jgi:hypothetical protein